MIVMKEARSLVLVKCFYNSGLDVYIFSCEGKKITLQYMTDAQIIKLFKAAQLKDTSSIPRSAREKTYAEMVQGIKDGSDTECWIWSNKINDFFSVASQLQKERTGA